MKLLPLILSMSIMAFSAYADERVKFEGLIKAEEEKGVGFVPDKITPLPSDIWVYATDKDGKAMIMSRSGRFAIIGDFQMADLWTVEKIDGHAVAERSKYMPMKRLDRGGDQIAGVFKGVEHKESSDDAPVYVFTDPLCKTCNRFIQYVEDSGLYDQYSFKFVYMPAVSKDSRDAIKSFHCQSDSTKYQVLKTGEYRSLKADTSCNFASATATSILAEQMGIKRIPYVVNPVGLTATFGDEDFKNLEKFLSGK